MADVFTNDLRIREQEVGANSGAWGGYLNTSLENIAEAFSYGTEALADSAAQTLTLADGASDELRSLYLKLTGTLSQATTVTIAPNTISKCWFIENATTGGYDVNISQGSGANVGISNGKVTMIATDGAGSGGAVYNLLTDLELAGTLLVNDDLSVQGAAPTFQLYDTTVTNNLTKFEYDETFLIDIDKNNARGSSKLEVKIDGSSAFTIDSNRDVAIPDGGLTITTSDNTPQLSLVSTDADANIGPVLELWRNSASPADNDEIARIYFYGENDNNEKMEYVLLKSIIVDASDGTEDSALQMYTYTGGAQKNRIDLLPTETVLNESGADINTRVEGDTNAVLFTVDAGTDEVRIPHNISAQTIASLNVRENGAAIEFGHQNNTGQYYGTLGAFGSNGSAYIGFATDSEMSVNTFTTRGTKGCLITSGSGDMQFMAVTSASATGQTPVERVRILNDGGITFNGDTAAANALNDYEEGSFSMGVSGATFADGNYNQTAYYTKIGQLVNFYYYTSNYNCSSASLAATFTGLPFTSKGAGYTMFQYLHGTGVDGNSTGGYVNVSATTMVFVDENSTALSTFVNGTAKYIMVQGQFVTDS